MPEPRYTKEELEEMKNLEAVVIQKMQFRQGKHPGLEARGLEIAESYGGKDVSSGELKEIERKIGIFSGYVANALCYTLGYSRYEDHNIRPANHPARIIYTKRTVCPHCGKILHGYLKEEN